MVALFFDMIFMSGLVGLASYILHTWSHKGGWADQDGNVKRPPRKNKETGKKQKRKTGHYGLDQWFKFGGGYYGTFALIQLILSEARQSFEFLTNWEGIIAYLQNFGIGSIIDFFVNQINMFIQAIIWPVHYLEKYDGMGFILIAGLSYFAYKTARTYARNQHVKQDP